MKQIFATLILVWAIVLMAAAQDGRRFFVSPQGYGDGSSWQNAHNDLAAVLAMARSGDQIWVATGTYIPSQHGDRRASFVIPSGVQIFGGFAGFETSLKQRRLGQNFTVLSGDIGQLGNPRDNSYTVVYCQAVSESTLLDGVHITGGFADANHEGVHPSTCGGGIFIDSQGRSSAPVFRNCVIRDNYAINGGGVYVYANQGVAAPTFINSSLKNNRAELYGGGITNDSRQGNCETSFTNCYFITNVALYGAGMANQGQKGSCLITLKECDFINNFADLRGGAILSENQGAAQGKVVF
ncbi:MAG: hypothetical protein D6772_07210, partial [Bacteroidetes bacterium]